MPFIDVSFVNFRNLNDNTIDLLSKEVYFVGNNGQGKSNILESLYLIAYGSSFRTNSDIEVIKDGFKNYILNGAFKSSGELCNTISVRYGNGKKKILYNEKPIIDRRDLIQNIPCVLFSHEDLDFIDGSPERKRWFIDQTLSMYSDTYLEYLRNYKKIVKSRNIILKESGSSNIELLRSLAQMLIANGIEVMKLRQSCIDGFNTFFGLLYEQVSGIANVEIVYESSWKSYNEDEIYKLLLDKEQADSAMGTTLTGPHRDRIKFLRDKKPFVPSSSTGQKRLLSLLLRTAQATFYTKKTGKLPVLLMDDVMLELDVHKRKRFFDILPEYDQLFCTFLPEEPYDKYKQSTTRIYHIDNGGWQNG